MDFIIVTAMLISILCESAIPQSLPIILCNILSTHSPATPRLFSFLFQKLNTVVPCYLDKSLTIIHLPPSFITITFAPEDRNTIYH